MTNDLVVRQELTPTEWQMINNIAPVMHASRLFGVASPAAAAAIMLKGRDLGLSFTSAFELIHVIDGKPSLSPKGALTLLHQSREIKAVKIDRLVDDKGNYIGHDCTIERVSGFTYTARWTLKDAERAGLIKEKSGWAKYPERMCLWRAIGHAAAVAAPDVIGGMYTSEEYGAPIDDDGVVIPGQWVEAETDGIGIVTIEPDAPDETLDAALAVQGLVNEYGSDAVLAANGGAIPTTLEEVDAIRYALIAEGE